ncbi:MAG: Flp family type IVb pilin [Acidobacteria bacterium]|jgi:Flp pilus assembly pilin Flp|nr:Flp family type IVb pilin [Acidobacteriota bacterium]
MNTVKSFLKDDSGLELSEYAVAAALITLVIVAAFTDLGTAIAAKLVDLKGKVNP